MPLEFVCAHSRLVHGSTKPVRTKGVVARKVELVDQDKIGLGLSVFVSLENNGHSDAWLEKFAQAVCHARSRQVLPHGRRRRLYAQRQALSSAM
jgi:hypothetical protein